jgi:hypothetical protein
MPCRRLLIISTILAFLVIQCAIPQNFVRSDYCTNPLAPEPTSQGNTEVNNEGLQDMKQFQDSANTLNGVIDPALVEQQGYSTTGVLEARTDSGFNAASSIPIDNNTGWMGSQTQIRLWDMERLYAENGTFDEGISGTNTYPNSVTAYPYGWGIHELDWYDPSGGTQTLLASYNSNEGYVVVETHGEKRTNPSILYWHYSGTYVYWNQTVNNVPYSDNLTLTFKYNYDSGILDKYFAINGYILLTYFIDNDIYIIKDLMDMNGTPARKTWYDVTVANITNAPSSFQFGVGIYIYTTDSKGYFVANPGQDYDADGGIDGDLTRVIRVLLDDIKLVGNIPPTYEQVNLKFHAGVYEALITQLTNYGTAIITNPSYWDESSVSLGISSNVSISCSYEVKLLAHNFKNTTRTTQPTQIGVTYSILPGESSFLNMFTYIGSEGVSVYENFTVQLYIPVDWENATIYDPFLNDVTSQCTMVSGRLVIPTSILNRLGWWQITLNSPNYAKSITSQIRDGASWSDATLYRPGNITRTSVEIGTLSQIPNIVDPVNVAWIQPDQSIWYQVSVNTGIGGVVETNQTTLLGNTTIAGKWAIAISWNNGSEVAYGTTSFDMYHTASIEVPSAYESINTERGLTISNFVYYTDADTSAFLLDDSVTITANWSSTTIPFTQDFVKNWWRGEFDTAAIEGGLYVVVVTASRPYFDNVSATFTIISTYRTSLELTNAGDVPIESGLNEIFTVHMNYDYMNGTGIIGAIANVSHSGPSGGLKWKNFTDYGNGHYSIDFICNISDTYPITVMLMKAYHQSSFDTFTLIIGETGSELQLLNGTADVVLYGNSYRLVVEYRNSTGQGLPGANLQVISATPSSGINYTGFNPISEGYYEITFTPSSAGTFSIVVRASILNHETQYATFTLTATGIPTILTSLPSSTTIAINQTFILQLRFQDESFNTINGATITLVNPPSGLLVSAAVPAGNGLYNVTIQALEIRTFDLLFRATKGNCQNSSAGFSLVVTEIQTSLRFAGDITSTITPFSDTYSLTIYYEQSSPVLPVQGANISILPADVSDLEIHVTEFAGYYVVSIRGNALGSWILTVMADKAGYRLATKQFLIEIERIDTTVQGSSPLEALLIGRSYTFNFSYIFESNSSDIHRATILAGGDGADWINYLELGSGQYQVNLTPLELGAHYVLLTFERTGFETVSYRLTFSVDRVPIKVQVIEGLNGPELSTSTVIVRVSEIDTDAPVSGAEVYCYVTGPSGVPTSYLMEETSTFGLYSAVIMMPEAEGVYQLKVTCNAANYVLDSELTVQLQPARSIATMLWVTTTRYYPFMLILAAVGVGLMYRRSARKRRIRENKATLAVKKRFDDIRSLLGVIVIHKESGLPVYSKILRDGLEETVISAFITAITSFRGEFDIESSSDEWGLIPISDIVRVISTSRLVCAFITTGNPSPEQRERMIQFAKTVGFIFDESLGDIPIVVLDQHTKMQFDALFEDILDGALLRTYKLDEAKRLPTNTCANERIARKQGAQFKLEELASEIAACGLEEGRVYKAIMTALENHFLVTTDESPFASEIIRASEEVPGES